MLTYFVEASCS